MSTELECRGSHVDSSFGATAQPRANRALRFAGSGNADIPRRIISREEWRLLHASGPDPAQCPATGAYCLFQLASRDPSPRSWRKLLESVAEQPGEQAAARNRVSGSAKSVLPRPAAVSHPWICFESGQRHVNLCAGIASPSSVGAPSTKNHHFKAFRCFRT